MTHLLATWAACSTVLAIVLHRHLRKLEDQRQYAALAGAFAHAAKQIALMQKALTDAGVSFSALAKAIRDAENGRRS